MPLLRVCVTCRTLRGLMRLRKYGALHNAGSLEAGVAAELAALPRALLELAAGGAALGVDAAGVCRLRRAEVHAGAFWREREGALTEVALDEALRDVVSTAAPPAHDVLDRDQNAPFAGLPAAGATLQAVELRGALLFHARRVARRRARVELRTSSAGLSETAKRAPLTRAQRARVSRTNAASADDSSSGVDAGAEQALSEHRYTAGRSG
jgi:hypothetical protein